MSLSTYADLQTQVANWLARTDLTAYIPDMITLFEASAARKLRVRPQVTTTNLSTSSGVGSLPSDFLGAIDVMWNGTPQTSLNYVHPSMFVYYDPSPSANGGPAQIYTIVGGNIKIDPIDDSGLVLTYYQKAGALSSTLNWLWTNHPDAYLFGTLCEANYFNKGSALPMAMQWGQRRDAVFDEIQMQEFRERGNLAIQIKGNTP